MSNAHPLGEPADDLGALLTTAPAPLFLVGHSWGGPIVCTLVLVDQTDEHIDSSFAPALAERMAARPPRFSSLGARPAPRTKAGRSGGSESAASGRGRRRRSASPR